MMRTPPCREFLRVASGTNLTANKFCGFVRESAGCREDQSQRSQRARHSPSVKSHYYFTCELRTKSSEAESAGNDRPPHMDVEAKPAFASGNIEIEAAIAEVQVPRLAEGIVDSAEH